jgi:DNA-binding transcriptional LysR family regulator
VLNLPTAEIANRLREGTVDLGLVRSGTIARPLRSAALGRMSFSLFVPAKLLSGASPGTLKDLAGQNLPFAALEGSGQFRQELEQLFRQQKAGLNLQLELSSFPLVGRAVRTGRFAAILPAIAAAELDKETVTEIRLNELRRLDREILLAWNPRVARIRASVDRAIPVFRALCRVG